jgi:hypothetical protein
MSEGEVELLEDDERLDELPPVPEHGDGVQEIWYNDSDQDGYWYGRDDHGEFRLDGGSPTPNDSSDLAYEPCNAILRHYESRYGERRFCKAMSGSNFGQDYDTCRRHKNQEALLEHRDNNFSTGAHAANHRNKFKFMDPAKKVITNDLYRSLVEQSAFDFDMQFVELQVDVSDDQFGGDTELMVLEHPVPRTNEIRCKALWHAAIDFTVMDLMRDKQFQDAFDDGTVVGEREQVVAVTDDGQVIEDEEEHHLNLPISRIQKDYKEHLQFGGVAHDVPDSLEDDGAMTSEWHVEITPQESDDSQSASSLDLPSGEGKEPSDEEDTNAYRALEDDEDEVSPLHDIQSPESPSEGVESISDESEGETSSDD